MSQDKTHCSKHQTRNIDRLIACARDWIGTPYLHQHRERGHGVDCGGLIIGAGLEAGVLSTWTEARWAPHAAYGRAPNPIRMTRAIAEFLDPLDVGADGPPPGAVAFMGWRAHLPMHLAIMSSIDGRPTMIHAFSYVGRVVEHGFSAEWPGRVISWWSYPGI